MPKKTKIDPLLGVPREAESAVDIEDNIPDFSDEEEEQEDGYNSAATSDDTTPMEMRGKQEPDEMAQVEKYSADETRDVWTWKMLVIMLLLVAGGFSAAVAATFARDVQNDAFNVAHENAAQQLSQGLEKKYTDLIQNMETLAQWIVMQAQVENPTPQWPNVTLATFNLMAQSVSSITGVDSVAWAPFVTAEQHTGWHVYALLQEEEYRPTSSSIPPNNDLAAPIWQTSPEDNTIIGYDLLAKNETNALSKAVNALGETLLTGLQRENNAGGTDLSPRAVAMTQIVDQTMTQPVGLLIAELDWKDLLREILSVGNDKETIVQMHVVLRSSCSDETNTFKVLSNKVEYVGPGDLHEVVYDDQRVFTPFYQFKNENIPFVDGHCFYSFHSFPTSNMQDRYEGNVPALIILGVAALFSAVTAAFMVYDFFVAKRQTKIVHAAARSEAIVASVFPATVRDRLMEESTHHSATGRSSRGRLRSLMNDGLDLNDEEENVIEAKPIADLFPEVTIMFADISGFTAWSSTREPSQVFILLETIYAKFDAVAKKRRIFKVETVGDCYVAATGLPDPRPEHAVAMARFARDCVKGMREVVDKLDRTLGPDTSDLEIRVGLNSGQVTAGVLRGDRSRFQLFGDTMNTASRMESTGLPGRVQISKATAEELAKSGKAAWFTPREDKVMAKGKGHLSTYWLKLLLPPGSGGGGMNSSDHSLTDGSAASGEMVETLEEKREDKTSRLTTWAVDIMRKLLVDIEARRRSNRRISSIAKTSSMSVLQQGTHTETEGGMVLDEVQEIIHMPKYTGGEFVDKSSIALSDSVTVQLERYIKSIASMYNSNYFHNFEHALHVTNSTIKLLGRIVSPEIEIDEDLVAEAVLHDHTYGITSDPLTQFACVFSALIHDVDHQGVPNARLIVENPTLASLYKNRSVAEQNSVDLSWHLLEDPSFADLQRAIYRTPEEKHRFRQLVVNGVMATDIADKELKTLRNKRWDRAFKKAVQSSDESRKEATDRKATIVIEHLLQASDIAHTMQHWHIYRKWNERLFVEMLTAYRSGRADKDPATFWYEGELGFFDFYIIPLAMKLKECGVFGVSSDEYLNYAQHNRAEWHSRGKEILAEMVQKHCAQ